MQLGSRQRILIVDDDERIAHAIRCGLSGLAEFEVETQTSGPGARSALRDAPFDMLITDWCMPDVDGLTLIAEARNHSPQIAAVLMTAFDSAQLREAATQAAVHHYVEKPFQMDELVQVIRAAMPFPVPTPSPKPAKPIVLKVILGGDANVGKTSLIHRFRTGRFEPIRKLTIGVDFHGVDLDLQGKSARLMVWDLGGQGRFSAARQGFYRGSLAVGLIFDAGNRTSFYNLMRWWREIRSHIAEVPVILLANKCDLERQVTREEAAAALALAWGISYYEASCATGEGVANFFAPWVSMPWTIRSGINAVRKRRPDPPNRETEQGCPIDIGQPCSVSRGLRVPTRRVLQVSRPGSGRDEQLKALLQDIK